MGKRLEVQIKASGIINENSILYLYPHLLKDECGSFSALQKITAARCGTGYAK